jgi:SAM-dependent methyltransferase
MNTIDEHLRLEFNEWARAGRGEGMEKGHRPVGEQAIEKMHLHPTSIVLDVGCGSGWATRLMAEKATRGRVVGIDISDEMVGLSRDTSREYQNIEFKVATAEALPFRTDEFTHAFSMESLYYYSNMMAALREIHRVIVAGGLFVTVIDLYLENHPSHRWVDELKVPVHLLGIPEYRSMLQETGYVNIKDRRLRDPAPIPERYTGSSFSSHEEFVQFKQNGSLMLTAEVRK